MCGIVGAVAEDDILPVLLGGLRRLEYRGYDSAGIAVINRDRQVSRTRSVGKIIELERAIAGNAIDTAMAPALPTPAGRPMDRPPKSMPIPT